MFYDRYFDIIEQLPVSSSPVKKQLLKLPAGLQGVDRWKETILYSFEKRWVSSSMAERMEWLYHIREPRSVWQRERVLELLLQSIQPDAPIVSLNAEDVKLFQPFVYSLNEQYLALTLALMDLYAIMRMIKPPAGGLGPTLVVSFAGAEHGM